MSEMEQNTFLESKAHHIILWVVLIGIVLFLAFRQQGRQVESHQGENDAPTLTLLSRYSLGASKIQGALTKDPAANKLLLLQLDTAAVSKRDKVKVAIMAGELLDRAAALTRLHSIPGEEVIPMREALMNVYIQDRPLTDEDKTFLEEELGWFGLVALSHDLADDDPKRIAALKAGTRTFVTMFGGGMAAMGAAVIGMILFIFAAIFYKKNRLKHGYLMQTSQLTEARTPYLEAFILFLLFFVFSSQIGSFLPPSLMWVTQAMPLLCLFWLPIRKVSSLKMTLGLHSGDGLFKEMGCGIAGYLSGLPILLVGLMFSAILMKFSGGPPPAHPIVNWVEGAGVGKVMVLFFMASIAAPLIEETLFRGAFYHYLRGPMGAVLAALINGVIFAAIHPQGFAAIPVLASIGAVFGLIREWRGSLIAPMTAHFCNNSAVLSLLILTMSQ